MFPASSLSAAAQPGAQGDAGLRFGVFPLLRPPAPLSSGVGHVEERARARRVGRFAGNFELEVVLVGKHLFLPLSFPA